MLIIKLDTCRLHYCLLHVKIKSHCLNSWICQRQILALWFPSCGAWRHHRGTMRLALFHKVVDARWPLFSELWWDWGLFCCVNVMLLLLSNYRCGHRCSFGCSCRGTWGSYSKAKGMSQYSSLWNDNITFSVIVIADTCQVTGCTTGRYICTC